MIFSKVNTALLLVAVLAACSSKPDENQALYDEYHQIMCRDKSGDRTLEDAKRQGELNKIILDKVAPNLKFPSEEARELHMKRFAAATDVSTCVIKPKSPDEQAAIDTKVKEISGMLDELHAISCKVKNKTANPNERLHSVELAAAILKHEMVTKRGEEWLPKLQKAQNPDDCVASAEPAMAAEPVASQDQPGTQPRADNPPSQN